MQFHQVKAEFPSLGNLRLDDRFCYRPTRDGQEDLSLYSDIYKAPEVELASQRGGPSTQGRERRYRS